MIEIIWQYNVTINVKFHGYWEVKMNAVKVFKNKIKRIKRIDSNGNIEFEIGELSEEEIEDLKHLRVNNINGVIFDDREIVID